MIKTRSARMLLCGVLICVIAPLHAQNALPTPDPVLSPDAVRDDPALAPDAVRSDPVLAPN